VDRQLDLRPGSDTVRTMSVQSVNYDQALLMTLVAARLQRQPTADEAYMFELGARAGALGARMRDERGLNLRVQVPAVELETRLWKSAGYLDARRAREAWSPVAGETVEAGG